jgi:anaerobic selenocysteine-containing dehydrogenase
MKKKTVIKSGMDRREFLKRGAFLGGSAFLTQVAMNGLLPQRAEAGEVPTGLDYPLAKPENILYSVCQQCNAQCGIKAKIKDGVVVKIDGSPFSPWNMAPPLAYKTSLVQAATVDAALCPKGQAGIQSSYDPYRVIKVLKRAGARGSNRWITVSFEQAINEIVNGGRIFAHVRGEEKRLVSGLKEIWALRDPKTAAAMDADVKGIMGRKSPEEKKQAVEAFKAKYKDHLQSLIDPDHPDLGPKNNQLVFVWGRLKAARGDLISRFTKDAFGSVNAHGHTTVCQGSLYFTGKAMSEQYVDGRWTGGKKFFWQADIPGSEFVIFVGTNPFEANVGPTSRAPQITNGLVSGRFKYVVIDPRMSRTAALGWKWLPNKPGSEAAIALAMIRWIIENGRYDERYLHNANKAAAAADGEPNWCNASWLVRLDREGKPGPFLRASEAGLAEKETRKTADGKGSYQFDPFVTSVNGRLIPFDPYDGKNAVEGDLFVDSEIGGVRVKSALKLLSEGASGRSIEEWAELAGLKAEDLVEVAQEFVSHGKKAAAEIHRGVSQHTNGFYNCSAWYALNLLIGNYDWKGGMAQASTYDHFGGRPGKPFALGRMHPGKIPSFGISIIRHDVKYEDTTLFAGYPAKRPWYPLASDIYQEIVPSAGAAYPYPIKALFIYMGTPVYALPAGHTNIEILADVKKIPLIVASDITIGETSMYADYILPDQAYLERWELAGSHPWVIWKVQPIRQPVIAAPNETVKVFGEPMSLSLEAMLLGLAEKLGLPGFGPGGLGEKKDLLRAEDFYLPMVANVAFGDRPDGSDVVPDADEKEIELFLESRRHLPKAVFNPERWKSAVGEKWWRKVIFVLNRGGRFDDFANGYEGEKLKNPHGTLINLYQEKTATTKNSMTGKPFPGVATYLPGPTDALGRPLTDEGYDLHLITHREVTHTKSRTIADYWLLTVLPEGILMISKADAARLGFKNGDQVKVASASNPEGVWDLKNGVKKPMIGKLTVTDTIRPGVVSFSLGHGHWAYGASDVVINGKKIRGDKRREVGVHANAAMRIDPLLKDTCLSDVTGASAVFYDTKVKLVKV